jgi:DNA-binding NarL/FixJ family response regulator
MSIAVLIADDHAIVREGLRALLGSAPGFHVVGEASDGRRAVELAATLKPDVVLMDISMRGLNGVEATRRIASERSRSRVLALSMHTDMRSVSRMMEAGAAGYLVKDCMPSELTTAIETVAGGGVYVCPEVRGSATLASARKPEPAATGLSSLSAREREVLQLLAEGQSTRDIAMTLRLSEKTVENHRQQLRDKLGIASTAELTKFAIREGLTNVEF